MKAILYIALIVLIGIAISLLIPVLTVIGIIAVIGAILYFISGSDDNNNKKPRP